MEVMGKYLWMAVTADKYELPLCVFDTAEELGKRCGVAKGTIYNAIGKGHNGRCNGFKYVRVLNDGE